MRDIGAQVRVEEVRNFVGKKEGKGSILLVKAGSEQKRRKVIREAEEVERKGEKDRRDLTWRERERGGG